MAVTADQSPIAGYQHARTGVQVATALNLAESALQPNAPAQLGGAESYLEILADGTLRLVGSATVFDDITQGIAAALASDASADQAAQSAQAASGDSVQTGLDAQAASLITTQTLIATHVAFV